MAQSLEGKKIAVLAADMVEQVELEKPTKALKDAGAEVVLVSLEKGEIRGYNHYDPADSFSVDQTVDEADGDDYDGLLIPGGVGNPDQLRASAEAVSFVKSFFDSGKPVASICHGPWVLVEAGVVEGRTLTGFKSIKTDVLNAGGDWVDQEVVQDGNLVTSRGPDDIPAFNEKILSLYAEGVKSQSPALTGAGG